MAYRYEKNPNTQDTELVIDGFEKGIADSPYEGFQFMQNLNIKNYPQGLFVNSKRNQPIYSTSAPTNDFNYMIQDPQSLSDLYALDSAGKVWHSSNAGFTWDFLAGNTQTGTQGNGITIFGTPGQNRYLLVFRTSAIDAVQIVNGGTSGSWINSFATLSNAIGNRMAITGRDNTVYSCNGNFILSIKFVGTFDPNNPATFVVNQSALTLPQNIYPNSQATWLCELGTNLVIAAGRYLYPWDKVSPLFDVPIPFTENIAKIVNIGNYIYCFSGIVVSANDSNGARIVQSRGNIYVYNGYTPTLFKKMPDTIVNGTNNFSWYFGGVMSHNNKLYFGARTSTGTFSGIYSIDIDITVYNTESAGALNCEYTDPFTPTSGAGITTTLLSLNNVAIGTASMLTGFASGWTDENGQIGLAINDSNNVPYSTSTLITDLISVGLFNTRKTYHEVELRFNQPLSSGENYTLKVATSYNGSLTTVVNNFTSSGTEGVSYVYPVNVENFEYLQANLTLGSVTSGSRCMLKEIRFRDTMNR